jgi:hypothetical protein
MYLQQTGRRNRELLVTVMLLNVVALGCYGVLFAQVKAKNENTSVLLNKIDAEATEAHLLASTKTLVSDTATLREQFRNFSVSREGVVPFIELLESAGKAVGVSVAINSVDTETLPGSTTMEMLRVQVTGKGSWPDIVRFFGLLEFLPFEVALEQAIVSSSEGVLWRLAVTFTVLKDI